MEKLPGMRLDEALALLEAMGIRPELICSMPPFDMKDQSQRTARVVRYQDGQLLYSCFKDGSPEGQ